MKKKTYLALLLAFVLALSACAQKAAEPKTEQSTAENTPVANEEQAETEAEVENNGGYYVRVNDKVYFRRYGEDAPAETAVFGEFTKPWSLSGASEILSLDLKSGELDTLCAEEGCGPLWYGDGGFYLNERFGGEDSVWWYALDGAEAEHLCAGTPLGVTESGLLAVERMENGPEQYRTVYAFYRGKAAAGEAEISNESYVAYAGMTDAGVFLLQITYDEDAKPTVELLQLTPEGKSIDLGTLPELEESSFYDVQADRFLASGDTVTVGVGYYAGTGHFLNEYAFVSATIGQEGSVRDLDADIEMSEGDLPRLRTGEDGAILLVPALPGELRIEYETGDLQVFEGGEWRVLAERLCLPRTEGNGYRKIEQHMDYIGGTAYVTLACVHASPQDSVGWRDAFTLLDMLYIATDGGGAVKELSCVDRGAELYGDVWFIEGASTALWRQRRFDAEEDYVPEYAYAIPIAEDADWMGGWEAVYDGVTGLLDYDYGEGEAEYYGYPVPEGVEPAGTLCLALDRDGIITRLANKAPEDMLAIDFDLSESELSGAVKTLAIERRAEDEDTPWFWTKLCALEDGVRVRVERSAEDLSGVGEMAMTEGVFIPGETLYDGVLNYGDFIALRASLPWHPELRVSVSKDGTWGSYIFGEDNWMHLRTEESVHPRQILSALPMPDVSGSSGESLTNALSGTWLYRSPETGEVAATLQLDADGTVLVRNEKDGWQLDWELGRIFREEYETPDLLCLRTEQSTDTGALAFDGSAGDYLIDLYRTDGEEVLHLTQANNGDGALSYLLSGASPETWKYDFVLTRAQGVGASASRYRDMTFPAAAVRYDDENGGLWLRKAEIADAYEDGSPVWRPAANAPCVRYPFADGVPLPEDFSGCDIFLFSVDINGGIAAIEALDS